MNTITLPHSAKKASVIRDVTESGSLVKAARINKIDNSIIDQWRREDKKFNLALEFALKSHYDQQVEKLNEIQDKLIKVAEEALEVRIYQVKSTTKEQIANRSGVVTGTREWTSVKEKVCEPNIPAVLKVLTEINRSLFLQYSNYPLFDTDQTLIEQIIGQNEAFDLSNQNLNWVMGDEIDLIRIRKMQAQTQVLYNKGLLDYNEYRKRTIQEMRLFQDIQRNIEARLRNEFEGKTLLEVRNDVKALLNLHHALFQKVIANSKIKRQDIYLEFQNLLKEHKNNE